MFSCSPAVKQAARSEGYMRNPVFVTFVWGSDQKKGYFWHGASTFWTMSFAPSTTSVISTTVSSIFSAVIRSSGIDSAKPHLSPAFLASVKRKESVWISCDDSRREFVGRIKCGTVRLLLTSQSCRSPELCWWVLWFQTLWRWLSYCIS